jgi:hypothetical protein
LFKLSRHETKRRMKGVNVVIIISMLVVLAMVQLSFMARPGQAMTSLTCEQVGACLAPCIPFLTQGGEPSSKCCEGVKNIKASTPTAQDKRDACECVKAAANHLSNLKDDMAAALPTKCKVQMDIPVSRTTNCDTYVRR